MEKSLICIFAFCFFLGNSFKYDYYTFSMEVPQATCDVKNCQKSEEGNIGSDTLNVHGLWPSATDGNHPFECQPNIYDPKKLNADVLTGLDANWVGMFNSTYWFRFHEYGKHGTCFNFPGNTASFLSLGQVDQVTQMNAYFQKALDLKAELNLKSVLFAGDQEQGCFKFSHTDLMATIRKQIGVDDVLIECNNKSGMQKLSTIEVCLGLDFKVVDCSSVRKTSRYPYKSSCHEDQPVYVEELKN